MCQSSSECNVWMLTRYLPRKCKLHKPPCRQPRIQCLCHQIGECSFEQWPRSSRRRWTLHESRRTIAILRITMLRSKFHQCQFCTKVGFSWNILGALFWVIPFAYRYLFCARSRRRSRKELAPRSLWYCTFDRSIARIGADRRMQRRNQSRTVEPHTKSSCRSCREPTGSYVYRLHDRGRITMVSRIWIIR